MNSTFLMKLTFDEKFLEFPPRRSIIYGRSPKAHRHTAIRTKLIRFWIQFDIRHFYNRNKVAILRVICSLKHGYYDLNCNLIPGHCSIRATRVNLIIIKHDSKHALWIIFILHKTMPLPVLSRRFHRFEGLSMRSSNIFDIVRKQCQTNCV